MVQNSRYDGFASLDRLDVPETSPKPGDTSPPIGTTTTFSPNRGPEWESCLEQLGRGVTAGPQTSLTAAGGELRLVVRVKGDGEYTLPVLCVRVREAPAKEARQRMWCPMWLWQRAGRVRAGLLWCLGGVTNGPKEVRVRVDVVVTRRVEYGPPPEVKVKVEQDLMPPNTLLLPPEVRVRVEGPHTPPESGSMGTAPEETSS